MTSGQGGLLPPDLPVGLVAEVSESGVRIQPFVDFDHMEHLRLVDYELPRILRFSDSNPSPGALWQTSIQTVR